MNTPTHTHSSKISLRSFLPVIVLSILGFFIPTLHAEHDHDHILVITLHGTLAAIRDHIGKQARISIGSNDTWTHFAIPTHQGAVRIHTVKRIVE